MDRVEQDQQRQQRDREDARGQRDREQGDDMIRILGQISTTLMQQRRGSPERAHGGGGGIRSGTLAEFKQLNPPLFYGTEGPLEAELWLRKTETYLRIAGVPDEHKADVAHMQMEGEAHDWWDGVLGQFPYGALWPDFRERFLGQYFPQSEKKKMEREFITLIQGKMTVGQYRAEFARLSRFAPHLVTTDEQRKDCFVQGLSAKLQRDLVAHKWATYAESVELAGQYERLRLTGSTTGGISSGPKRPFEAAARAGGPPTAKRLQTTTPQQQTQQTHQIQQTQQIQQPFR